MKPISCLNNTRIFPLKSSRVLAPESAHTRPYCIHFCRVTFNYPTPQPSEVISEVFVTYGQVSELKDNL